MKKLIVMYAICSTALYGCAQGVNLLAAKVSAAPGSLLYVGTDQLLKPLYAPAGSGTYLLSVSNGQYAFITLSNAVAMAGIKGDKGDAGPQGVQGIPGMKGDTGPQGVAGIPGQQGTTGPKGDAGAPANLPPGKAGQVLAYLTDNQLAAIDATFSLDAPSFSALTAPQTLSVVTAARGGQYSIGGYVYIRNTDGTGSVALQYTFTDNNGTVQSGSFTPVSNTAVNPFPQVIISCKPGTVIRLETIFSNPGMQAVYDTGANIHEK